MALSRRSRRAQGDHGYFRDVQDHLTRTVEQVITFDDLLNSILQARLAQLTVDQNNDMRKIAAWAAIAAVQTFSPALRHELHVHAGDGVAVRLSGGARGHARLGVALYRFFRRSGWL